MIWSLKLSKSSNYSLLPASLWMMDGESNEAPCLTSSFHPRLNFLSGRVLLGVSPAKLRVWSQLSSMMLCILDLKSHEYTSDDGALSPDSWSPELRHIAIAFMITCSCLNMELTLLCSNDEDCMIECITSWAHDLKLPSQLPQVSMSSIDECCLACCFDEPLTILTWKLISSFLSGVNMWIWLSLGLTPSNCLTRVLPPNDSWSLDDGCGEHAGWSLPICDLTQSVLDELYVCHECCDEPRDLERKFDCILLIRSFTYE